MTTSVRTRMSRQRILDGAWHILDSGTVGDLTVDAIARALHMSKSTLYKYFTSKEDVVVGLVEQACATTQKEAKAASDALKAGSLERAVESVLDLYAEHGERLPRAVLLEPGRLPGACSTSLNRAWDSLHEASRAAVASRAGHAELAATALSTSARAALVTAAAGELGLSRAEAARALRPLFVSGLGAFGATSV